MREPQSCPREGLWGDRMLFLVSKSPRILPVLQVQNIQVPHQEFGLSQNEPGSNFIYAQFDGIMGMAYPSLAMGGATTALQGMLQEGALTSPVFSFYLSK